MYPAHTGIVSSYTIKPPAPSSGKKSFGGAVHL